MISETYIDTDALRSCAEDADSLRKQALRLEGVLDQLIRANQESQDYHLCFLKATKLTYCLETMSKLLLQISDDADITIRQIQNLLTDYRYQAKQPD